MLAEAGGRALAKVINKFKYLKNCGYVTYTKLFESTVEPVLNYGSEIWGFGHFPKCDIVVHRAMRYFLGVHKLAPVPALYGDMGWMYNRFKRYISMIRYWNRLIKMDRTRLTRIVFDYFHDKNMGTWCHDMIQICGMLNMNDVYVRKETFCITGIKQKFMDIMAEECKKICYCKTEIEIV